MTATLPLFGLRLPRLHTGIGGAIGGSLPLSIGVSPSPDPGSVLSDPFRVCLQSFVAGLVIRLPRARLHQVALRSREGLDRKSPPCQEEYPDRLTSRPSVVAQQTAGRSESALRRSVAEPKFQDGLVHHQSFRLSGRVGVDVVIRGERYRDGLHVPTRLDRVRHVFRPWSAEVQKRDIGLGCELGEFAPSRFVAIFRGRELKRPALTSGRDRAPVVGEFERPVFDGDNCEANLLQGDGAYATAPCIKAPRTASGTQDLGDSSARDPFGSVVESASIEVSHVAGVIELASRPRLPSRLGPVRHRPSLATGCPDSGLRQSRGMETRLATAVPRMVAA